MFTEAFCKFNLQQNRISYFKTLKFKLLINSEYFKKNDNGTWDDKTKDELFIQTALQNAVDINVVGEQIHTLFLWAYSTKSL